MATTQQHKPRPDWAKRVDALLKKQGRTNLWLADKLHLERSQLSHLLSGDRRYVVVRDTSSPEFISFIDALADAFDIPSLFLLEEC